jgi:CTP:molybdopterin cytidylyltransferase MocA
MLDAVRGDTGAKELIRSAGLEFRQIEVRDRGIVEDVDVKAEGGVAI